MPEPACTGRSSFTGLSLPMLSASSSCDPPSLPSAVSFRAPAVLGSSWQLTHSCSGKRFRWAILLSLSPTLSHTLSYFMYTQTQAHMYLYNNLLYQPGPFHTAEIYTHSYHGYSLTSLARNYTTVWSPKLCRHLKGSCFAVSKFVLCRRRQNDRVISFILFWAKSPQLKGLKILAHT